MKKKSICLFFLIILAVVSYSVGYLYMVSYLSDDALSKTRRVLPVTAGKENFILPDTKLIEHIVNLKTGESYTENKPMPSIFLGLDRKDLIAWCENYMENLSITERRNGLVSYEVDTYSVQEVVLKKSYYPSEDYHHFFMIYKNNHMTVYYSDRKTVYDYPNINFQKLPIDIQCQLLAGMEIKDEVELYNFLQNYST